MVVGAGGLGSSAALYLSSAGVGQITLVDHDEVDLTNLQRQIGHTHDRIGQPKVESLAQAMRAINPEVRIHTLQCRADAQGLNTWVPNVDLVLDCCDNFATRQLVNAACLAHAKPLISGSAIRFDGQISSYHPGVGQSPCYACLFPPSSVVTETQCATMGVFAPLVGIIGSMQAAEAIKWLSQCGPSLVGRLLMLDARSMDWQHIYIQRQAHCPVCAGA